MSKFNFVDGNDICVYNDGKIQRLKSAYIERYKQNVENAAKASEWKKTGSGAIFRGDVQYNDKPTGVISNINAAFPTKNDDEIVYSFTVNDTSGIYKKTLSDEESPETHIVNGNDKQFIGGCLNVENSHFATQIKRNFCNSDIAIFNAESGDYKLVTDGDTLDEDPYICPDDEGYIYYSSRGVGRNSSGEFVTFSPSAIYRLDVVRVQVDELVTSEKFSYFRPIYHGGKLYAIKAPAKEKHTNPLLEIVLIPWRLLQAIAGFINIFITAFSGKSITEGGTNPAKGRDYDSRKIAIRGNLIDVEKQSKKNASKKDADYGFVPPSWQLIEVDSGRVIKSGILDYDICDDGTIIATNGRRIFEIKDGDCKKVYNTSWCLRVDCKHSAKENNSLADF
jgi:uncharacterized protein YbaA (DUF1428 family)